MLFKINSLHGCMDGCNFKGIFSGFNEQYFCTMITCWIIIFDHQILIAHAASFFIISSTQIIFFQL